MTFRSFFLAGFECSSHRRADDLRLDLIRATGHEQHALQDYRSCAELGLRSARDGLRWHRIAADPSSYDWSSWLPMVEAAEQAGVEIIWDLCHYGVPDWLALDSPDLPARFADFAAAAVRRHREATGRPAWVCPMNEISFFTWAVRKGVFRGADHARPGEFKRHLVRTALAGVAAVRAEDPQTRVTWAEPLIHVLPSSAAHDDIEAARQHNDGQYEATDLLLGLTEPELGGGPRAADVIGLNYYPDNQWVKNGSTIPLGHHDYRPLADLLEEAWRRFRKPLFLSETGCEGSPRPAWLHYVCAEVREAMRRGVPIEGVCLYPVTAYPGWDDSRHAEVGLFSTPHSDGRRRVYEPLAEELARQQRLFDEDFGSRRAAAE
jgi:beta-glucosidase/6-phospho-beta-glucosidase/beta-galactosidase